MGEDFFGEGETHGFEHDGPVNGVELEDILAEDLDVGGPEFGTGSLGGAVQGAGEGGITERGGDGDVIGEGVEPDVGDERGVERDGDAPVEAGGGPGTAEVFERIVFEETEDFIAAIVGFDEIGVGFDVIDEPRLVFAEAEIVVVFDQFDDLAVEGIESAVGEAVLFGEERFLSGRVVAAVFGLVEVAGFVESSEDGLNDFAVTRGGGADEIVVGEVEAFGQGFPGDGQSIAISLGFEALGLGGLLDLLSMFIQAGEEEHVVAEAAARAGDDVGEDLFIGVTEVRGAIDVIDRGGDVELFAHPGRIVTGRGGFGNDDLRLGMGGPSYTRPALKGT